MSTAAPSSLLPAVIAAQVDAVFGAASDPIEEVAARAARLVPGDVIVWEGDPATFVFTYVSPGAERLLGYPAADWLRPGFWADTVLHAADRNDAIAYCALATGQGCDHEFEYRAVRPDGALRWIHDIVKVVKGRKGIPERLRGLMVDVTEAKQSAGEGDALPYRRSPVLAPRAVTPAAG